MGYSVKRIRIVATAVGGVPGRHRRQLPVAVLSRLWNEDISSGQGLMAVALVIFARWNPVRCLWASLLFGGVGSLGLALQGQSLASPLRLLSVERRPYILTLES